jgi:hypothetical protein
MLDSAALLAAWEAGRVLHPLDRALAVLAAADPGARRGTLAALPLAERDRRLLALRAQEGGELAVYVECPGCAERLELSLNADQLVPGEEIPPGAAWEARGGGVAMRFRLPDSRDMAAAAACASVDDARRLLAARCVAEAADAGGAAVDELPDEALDALAARMEEVAPGTDVSLALACPACGTAWEAPLDVPGFVWTEVGARARRLLREVAALARAYHWSEAEILALPAPRRRAYLELAEA